MIWIRFRIGKTVDLDQYEKENPKDFTLLKRSTLSELKSGLFFKTKWGNIRPGWHLECAAIALKTLGPTHDIHTSGVALAFPHHENAIAISQAATDRPLANYWLHNEPVMFNDPNAPEDIRLTLRDLLGPKVSPDVKFDTGCSVVTIGNRFSFPMPSFQRCETPFVTLTNLFKNYISQNRPL